MVGIAQGLERQVVALEAEGSIPSIHPIFHTPSRGAEGGDKREGGGDTAERGREHHGPIECSTGIDLGGTPIPSKTGPRGAFSYWSGTYRPV